MKSLTNEKTYIPHIILFFAIIDFWNFNRIIKIVYNNMNVGCRAYAVK